MVPFSYMCGESHSLRHMNTLRQSVQVCGNTHKLISPELRPEESGHWLLRHISPKVSLNQCWRRGARSGAGIWLFSRKDCICALFANPYQGPATTWGQDNLATSRRLPNARPLVGIVLSSGAVDAASTWPCIAHDNTCRISWFYMDAPDSFRTGKQAQNYEIQAGQYLHTRCRGWVICRRSHGQC